MPSLRFLQISDLHLDSALQSGRLGLPPDKARMRLKEIRGVLSAACDLIRERDLGMLLLPGDIFDDEAVSQDTINFVIDHLSRLAPVPVVIAPGNHDYYSLGSPYNSEFLAARKQPPWPPNVHIFTDGRWATHSFPSLPHVRVTGMAHCANAPLHDRLLAGGVADPPRAADDPGISLLIFHGSRDNVSIPSRKMRTLPFSDAELGSLPFDYAAVGHYHSHAVIRRIDGRAIGAYAGCPAGRGLDEAGEKSVIVGEIARDGGESIVELETVRLDRRAIRILDVSCFGASHREAVLHRIEQAIDASDAGRDDMVQIRLTGRIAPGIDPRPPEGAFEDRFFHVSFDLSPLKPDYDIEHYRDETLRTTEARFARELLRRIESETDDSRRKLLENAMYYGLDALVQKDVAPRYED